MTVVTLALLIYIGYSAGQVFGPWAIALMLPFSLIIYRIESKILAERMENEDE